MVGVGEGAWVGGHHININKNALTAAVSLVCLEIRSRNEDAINSTRNRIYSLRVFHFLFYRRRYFLLFSELIQYACQRRSEIRLRSQAIRVYKYTRIQGPRFQRNYIIARDQKFDLHGTSFQSIRGPTCFGKALNFNLSCVTSTRNDSQSQFPRSPLGTPGTMTPYLCTKYKEKCENALLTQARLIKKRGHLLFTWSAAEGGGLTEMVVFPTYFPSSPPST